VPCTQYVLHALKINRLGLAVIADQHRFALSPHQFGRHALSHATDALEFKKLGLAVIDEHHSFAFPPHPDLSDSQTC